MGAIETQSWMIPAGAIAVLLAALGVRFYLQRRLSRTANRYRSRGEHAGRLEILSLTRSETARFGEAWGSLQNRFVDNPRWTVREAGQLAREVMQKRGYPMDDLERRAADISAHHAGVVANYRSAQVIGSREQHETVDIEDLRKAVGYYRALFDDLLEAGEKPFVSHERV